MKKYEIVMIKGFCHPKALRDIRPFNDPNLIVRKGEIGGIIQSENSLSQEGECWVYPKGYIWSDAAKVQDNAILIQGELQDTTILKDNAIVADWGTIKGTAIISGNAIISKATIQDNAIVTGDALITEEITICKDAYITSPQHYLKVQYWLGNDSLIFYKTANGQIYSNPIKPKEFRPMEDYCSLLKTNNEQYELLMQYVKKRME